MERTVSTSSPQFIWRTTGELMPYKRPELYSKQKGNSALTFRCCANMIAGSNITTAYQHFLIVPGMAFLLHHNEIGFRSASHLSCFPGTHYSLPFDYLACLSLGLLLRIFALQDDMQLYFMGQTYRR